MALDTFLLYLAAWTLVALSPGPAVFFAMSQAARHGMHGAVAGTGGILLGHLVCFTFVAFGLAAVLSKMDVILNGSKRPVAAASAVFASNAPRSSSLSGWNVSAASKA